MNKIQLRLVEQEDELNEELTTDEEVVDTQEDEFDEEVDNEESSFIDSDELNELRDIILDLPDDIELLLLNDNVIVLGTVDDQVTYLYTLPEEADDFVLIEMPFELDKIMSTDSIIKYTPDSVDSRHDKVVDLLMSKLEPEKEIEVTEEVDEDVKED